MSNEDPTILSHVELLAEYERSQFALAWALKALGGRLTISHFDMENEAKELNNIECGIEMILQPESIK